MFIARLYNPFDPSEFCVLLSEEPQYKYYWTDKKHHSFIGKTDDNKFFDPYVFCYKTYKKDKHIITSKYIESGETVAVDDDWENKTSKIIASAIGKALDNIRTAVLSKEGELNFSTTYASMKELKALTKNLPRYTYAQYFQALIDGKVNLKTGLVSK